jgi:hypothetical protein
MSIVTTASAAPWPRATGVALAVFTILEIRELVGQRVLHFLAALLE